MSLKVLRWPHPFRWAFSFIDDNDFSTLPSARTVYDYCLAHGFQATKTVWMHEPRRGCGSPVAQSPIPGATLDEPDYLEYVRQLSAHGIELCLHDVSAGNNLREEVLQGFASFESLFGYLPRVHIFHAYNCDHPYWGAQQYRSSLARSLVRLFAGRYEYYGHDPASPHYWSDVCRRLISYVRLYRTRRFNVLRCNPSMPYHLPGKPDVRLWFSASGSRNRLHDLGERELDRLAREDGAFLLYSYSAHLVQKKSPTHLAPDVEDALNRIGERSDCWRPTVSHLLDRCLATKNLIVSQRRLAYVLSNPTRVPIADLQFTCDRPVLYRSADEELRPDADGRYHLASLDAGGCVALYFSPDAADAGDPGGISALESLRMMLEEVWHLVWKRGYKWRRKFRRSRQRVA
jgi:hypothetical protein